MFVYGQFTDSYAPIMDGVGVMVQNYAHWLTRHGHRSVVVAPRVRDYAETDDFEVVRLQSMPLPPKKPYRLQMPLLSPINRRRLETTPFTLIHAHSPFVSGTEGLRLARRQNVPLVSTFHSKFRDDFVQVFHNDWIADTVTANVMRFFAKADVVWTVNESTLRTLREYGFQGRVDIIPNGCDMMDAPHDVSGAAEALNARYGIPPQAPLLLFVGQMAAVKNPMLVVSACAEMVRAGSPCHLLMVGEGPSLQTLRDQAQQLGIAERVHFAGVVRDRAQLAQCYNRASLFVFPSVYDNAPLVVREASAMGCPSLLLAGTNAAEGVRHGENGFLAENAELQCFAQALAQVLALSPEALRATGQRARGTLAFSWEQVVSQVEDRYAEIHREFKGRPTRRRRSQQ